MTRNHRTAWLASITVLAGALLSAADLVDAPPSPEALAEGMAAALAREWGLELEPVPLSEEEHERARGSQARYDPGLTG